MKIAFRADASKEIGTGHVIRCLTLAKMLQEQSAEILFVIKKEKGNLARLIEESGFHIGEISDGKNISQEEDAKLTAQFLNTRQDLLIVDHYGLDQKWESAMRDHAHQIMVIDDLANRSHDCDVLLDQNLFSQKDSRYEHLVPVDCRKLLGPDFALLRQEFYDARKQLKEKSGALKNILISFGGGCPIRVIEKTVEALCPLDFNLDVVLGFNPSENQQFEKQYADQKNISFHRNVKNMAEMMLKADLAIGAGGTTTWERCFLGLPSLIIVLADNQLEIAQAVDAAGIAANLGWHHEIDGDKIREKVLQLRDHPEFLKQMSRKALELMPSVKNPLIPILMEMIHETTA